MGGPGATGSPGAPCQGQACGGPGATPKAWHSPNRQTRTFPGRRGRCPSRQPTDLSRKAWLCAACKNEQRENQCATALSPKATRAGVALQAFSCTAALSPNPDSCAATLNPNITYSPPCCPVPGSPKLAAGLATAAPALAAGAPRPVPVRYVWRGTLRFRYTPGHGCNCMHVYVYALKKIIYTYLQIYKFTYKHKCVFAFSQEFAILHVYM